MIILTDFSDNLVALYEYMPGQALVVDPPDAASVLRALDANGLRLTTILATHHHGDHVGGISGLKRQTGCVVYGSDAARIPEMDQVVTEEQAIQLGPATIKTMETPGHTRTEVCYYRLPGAGEASGLLWAGDTLFVGGCGRLFEGTAEQMYDAFQKLKALPDDTQVYCGHEYTVENYQFALTIEPDNQAIQDALAVAEQALARGHPTVPSTIGQEKRTNLFMQANSVEAFARLRRQKDHF